jgi:hypothetical protein
VRNAARMKPLFAAKAASQKDLDDAVSADEVAAADVKSAKARLVEARLNVEYTRVEAPIGGVTSRALKSDGTLVNGPLDLLTTVSQLDPIYVNFGLSESEQVRLRQEAAAGKLQLPKDGRFEVADPLRGRQGLCASRQARLHRHAREQPDRHVGRARRGSQSRGRGEAGPVRAHRAEGRAASRCDHGAAARGAGVAAGQDGLRAEPRQQGDAAPGGPSATGPAATGSSPRGSMPATR